MESKILYQNNQVMSNVPMVGWYMSFHLIAVFDWVELKNLDDYENNKKDMMQWFWNCNFIYTSISIFFVKSILRFPWNWFPYIPRFAINSFSISSSNWAVIRQWSNGASRSGQNAVIF